jgi:hypothetical protein
MENIFKKGEYYTTLKDGDFFVDVYKHETAKHLYVVDINGYKNSLTTVVEKRKYRKELESLFFVPIANEIWNEEKIFDNIKKNRRSI